MPDSASLQEGYLDIPFKGGHNDLSRWKRFGGTLDRPGPPAPTTIEKGGVPRSVWSKDSNTGEHSQ